MKRKNKSIKLLEYICCLMLVFFTMNLQAQQARQLGLDEAIGLALNHDLQAKVDSSQINILTSRLNQSKQSTLPEVGLNLSYIRISDNITPFSVSFPTGNVTLNPQILNQSFNALQLKQLIWSGGKVKYGIELSKKEIDLVKLDVQKNKVNTSYNISALWYNIYVLSKSKEIIEANIATLAQSRKEIKNLATQGVVLENEVLKVDLGISSLESGLVEVTNSLNALNFNLCILTGLPTTTEIKIPAIEFTSDNTSAVLDSYIASALSNRVELKSINAYKEIGALGLKMANANYLPTISGIGSGNYNLPEQRLFPNKNQFTPTWFVGVNVNWAISALYKNKEKVQESKQSITKTNALYNQVQEGIILEVNAAYTEYLQAKQKISLLEKTVVQATENEKIEKNKLNASTINVSEYLDANNKLVQAKLNLSAAEANTLLAQKKLNKTIGK
jgi:outer membrane protein